MATESKMREKVAEEVRALLARRQISASELARRLGITQRYISRRLTGETAFDVDDLERIAAILEVEVTDLLPRREGRVVAPVRRAVTLEFPATSTVQATSPILPRPKGPSRPADDKLRVPSAQRRPGRIRSTARLAFA